MVSTSTPTAPKTKGRVPITRDYYDALVEAFREHGPVWAEIRRATGCAVKTARRAWEKGWPGKGYAPIKDVMAEEQREARERLEEQRIAATEAAAEGEAPSQDNALAPLTEEREQRRQHAIESRAEEAQLVRAARRNAIALQATMRHLLSGGHKLAEKVRQNMMTADLQPKEAAKVFQSIASMTRAANEASKTAMEMERKLVGAPESVVGHMLDLGSDQAAADEIGKAMRALRRAKARGLNIDLDIIDVEPETVATGEIVGARVLPSSLAHPNDEHPADSEADGVPEDDYGDVSAAE